MSFSPGMSSIFSWWNPEESPEQAGFEILISRFTINVLISFVSQTLKYSFTLASNWLPTPWEQSTIYWERTTASDMEMRGNTQSLDEALCLGFM